MKAQIKPSSKRRRSVLRVKDASWRDRVRELVEQTHLLWGVLVTLVFIAMISVIANWAREKPLIAIGQVMSETRAVRVEFQYLDEIATEQQRTGAAQRTLRIFNADLAALDEIQTSLIQLPRTVQGVTDIAELSEDIRRSFGLSTERLTALQASTAPPPLPVKPDEPATTDEDADSLNADVQATGGGAETTEPARAQPSPTQPAAALDEPRPNPNLEAWDRAVEKLVMMLRTTRPLLSSSAFGTATQEGLDSQIELVIGADRVEIPRNDPINLGADETLLVEIERIITIAGFTGLPAEIVRERLVREPHRPTFTYDAAATTQAQQIAAGEIQGVVQSVPKGQLIFNRGDTLDQTQFDLYRREMVEFNKSTGSFDTWTRRLGVAGGVFALACILAGYVAIFIPTIARRSARILWLGIVLTIAVGTTAIGAVLAPQFIILALLTPTTLIAILLGVAYSPRTALGLGAVLSALCVLALDLDFTAYLLCMTGIGTAVSMLGDISRRRAIVRMSVAVAGVQLVSAIGVGLIDRPITGQVLAGQTLAHAVQAAMSGLLAGMITLFVLPYIERVFDIATGMTLIELRDPKQPLLREMQQRAPGTYNHSLNVASIAESAADSIGADALLTYVGCLYHDIGKINKPDYFVENQARGHNKHDKLSPAMSLLVIVGHVKDGLEMAREHNLPKALHHFIEAHHGTTLVEFFFNRARQKAEAGSKPEDTSCLEPDPEQLPSEIDYRYPGPRPRTKEVAIVMLADAVESATRTLAEPTPSRIDALVRDFANRRLMDGQFDDCDLTLKELHTISDSISKTVASIYHGRVSYSESKKPAETAEAKPKKDTSSDEPPQEKRA